MTKKISGRKARSSRKDKTNPKLMAQRISSIQDYNRKVRDSNSPVPAPYNSIGSSQSKTIKKVVYSRQLEPDDVFYGNYDRNGLLVPPYSPAQLYSIYESSSILSPHIDAYVQNISGFDNTFKYAGPEGEKESDEAKKEKEYLKNFFAKVNERQSFKTVRKQIRRDFEVLGYCFMEVTRSADGEIACLYSVKAKYIRLARIDEENPQNITVNLYRGGKEKKITVRRRFRRYAQLLPGAPDTSVRWFKEYGDPRDMDAKTGKFGSRENRVKEKASELIHLRNSEADEIYGLPRWIGNILGIMGVRNADYINYDLFDSQGIPPLAIMVSGGLLTQDSIDTLEALLKKAKGYQNFNRLLLIEAQSEGGIDDKLVPKVEMKSLTESRKEDAMFQNYITSVEEKVRMDFRLPPLYLGLSEEYTRSTVEMARIVAEEQVFEPERSYEDEVTNNTIMAETGAKYWKFKSGGPPLVTGEGLLKGFDSVARAGVLTLNQALDIANRAMNLDYEEIEEEWANYPIGILNRLLDRGFFVDLQQLVDVLEGNAQAVNNPTALEGSGDIMDGEVEEEEISPDNIKQISILLNRALRRAKSQLVDDPKKNEHEFTKGDEKT